MAIMDSDHLCEPDFLRKTVPHFYDEAGSHKYDVGLVQTPWSFRNIHDNILSELDAHEPFPAPALRVHRAKGSKRQRVKLPGVVPLLARRSSRARACLSRCGAMQWCRSSDAACLHRREPRKRCRAYS